MDPTVLIASSPRLSPRLPGSIKTTDDAKPFAEQLVRILTGGDVRQAQLDVLLSNIQQLGKNLQSVRTSPPAAAQG
jgi:hypothetical protein